MSDQTPKELRTEVHTVDELRAGFQVANATCCDQCRASASDRFDRAIAKIRADAKVEALREAAFEFKTNPVKGDTLFTRLILPSCNTFAVFQLLARADNLEQP